MGPSTGQWIVEGLELLGGRRSEQLCDGGKLQLPPQQTGLPPGLIGFQRHQPRPGLAVLGHQDRFPAWAASINLENWVLASCTLTVRMESTGTAANFVRM